MKLGKSLVELSTEIERQAKARKDCVAPTELISMTDDARLVVKGSGFADAGLPLLENAHNQIGARLEIPSKYYDRMRTHSPDLLAKNVNHWMQANPEKRLVRTLDGNVRAFLSNRYQRIDNDRVANTVLPILAEVNKDIGGLRVASAQITDSRLYIKVVFDSMTYEIPTRVGDLVACGLLITNSETGLGALSVGQFMDRLKCTNGMIGTDMKRRFNHVGKARGSDVIDVDYDEVLSDKTKQLEDITALSKVEDVVRAALDYNKFRATIDKLGSTTKEKIGSDVVQAVEVLGDSFGFLETERKSVLQHLIEGGDLTRFGMIQAVTRTAADLESYDRATQFEAFGGNLLALPKPQWDAIANATA